MKTTAEPRNTDAWHGRSRHSFIRCFQEPHPFSDTAAVLPTAPGHEALRRRKHKESPIPGACVVDSPFLSYVLHVVGRPGVNKLIKRDKTARGCPSVNHHSSVLVHPLRLCCIAPATLIQRLLQDWVPACPILFGETFTCSSPYFG